MKGQEILGTIAFVISILVIIGLAIIFSILFSLYGHYKSKHIKDGHEDDVLTKQIMRKYRKIIEGNKIIEETAIKRGNSYVLIQDMSKIKTYVNLPDSKKDKEITVNRPVTIFETITQRKEKNKKYRVFLNVSSGILYFIFGVVLICAIVFKAQGQTFYFGDTSFLTVRTNSMETKNEKNTYLDDNGLDNQIMQYSLIGINKVDCEEDVKLYDVIAFKYEDTVYVHRVVRAFYNEEKKQTYFTTKGDANPESMSFELAISCDQIIGKYNGFQNYGLGVTFIYLQSHFGIISLLSGFLFLFTFNLSESSIEKNYYKRILKLSSDIDDELGFKRNIEVKEEKA